MLWSSSPYKKKLGLASMNYTGAFGGSEFLYILVILSLQCSDAGTTTHCELVKELLEVLHGILLSQVIIFIGID